MWKICAKFNKLQLFLTSFISNFNKFSKILQRVKKTTHTNNTSRKPNLQTTVNKFKLKIKEILKPLVINKNM